MESTHNNSPEKTGLEKAGETAGDVGGTIVEKTKDIAAATGEGIVVAAGFVAEKTKEMAVATGKGAVAAGKTVAEKGKEAAIATGTMAVAAGKVLGEKTKEGIEIVKDPHTKEVIVEKSKEAAETTKGIILGIEQTAEKAVDYVMGRTEDAAPTARDLVGKASEAIRERTETTREEIEEVVEPSDRDSEKKR